MKTVILSCLFCCSLLKLSGQEDIKTNGLFYKISLAVTLTNNEDYTIGNNEGHTFINMNGLFINNALGYQFDGRTSVDMNVEYDHYIHQEFNFLPIYFGFNYNILDFDDVVFIRGGYGKILKIGKSFENGTQYKAGLGYRHFDDNFKNSWLIGLDFARKRFGYKQEEKLSSVSIFVEFMVF